jgi:catechol 2,3-dioxygenase-like lactoylglutathione lyase family enzyme
MGRYPGRPATPVGASREKEKNRRPVQVSGRAIMESAILGIHHVTAIASDPQRNLDFYTEVLGLRLVKRTVNFDDPSTYHLYFGDEIGSPGSSRTERALNTFSLRFNCTSPYGNHDKPQCGGPARQSARSSPGTGSSFREGCGYLGAWPGRFGGRYPKPCGRF